jgi:hypothetical protein
VLGEKSAQNNDIRGDLEVVALITREFNDLTILRLESLKGYSHIPADAHLFARGFEELVNQCGDSRFAFGTGDSHHALAVVGDKKCTAGGEGNT